MVLACGLATVDVVQTVERVPGADEKVVALDTRVEAGGPALNAAVTAALLGMPSRLVTAVGPSPLGQVVRDACAFHGVALVDLAPRGFRLPVSTVLVTAATGQRAVASRNSLGPQDASAVADHSVTRVLEGISAVLVDGHHLSLATSVARGARERGIPVVADGGSWKPGLEDLLAHVDVLVASADLRSPTGDHLADLLDLGPRWVARTAGSGPVAWMAADGTTGEVPVARVHVVDTLGAGDVLHGALLADIGRRGARDLPGSLAVAVDAATRSVAAAGAHGWAGPRADR